MTDTSVGAAANGRAGGPRRRRQADRRAEAEQRILDQAEAVFAANGFNGTTLNEVAAATGVDTALLRYYFVDKDGLFDAVLARRSPYANEIRIAALDAYESEMGDGVTVEGIIDAFVRPAFEHMARDEGWRNYAAIIAYVSSSRGASGRMMSANYDAVSHRFIDLLHRAMPGAERSELFWAYHFFIGAFTFSLGQTGRIDVLSGGEASALRFTEITDRLILTLAAGIRALCLRDVGLTLEEDVRRRRLGALLDPAE